MCGVYAVHSRGGIHRFCKISKTSMISARFCFGTIIPIAFAFGGCATWSTQGIASKPPEKIRVAVLPVEIAVKVKHLRNIQTIGKSEKSPANEKEIIGQKLRQAADEITQDIEADLRSSYFFEVVTDSDVQRVLAAAAPAPSTASLTSIQIQDIGRAVGAQAVLTVKLSGYGAIKKKWLFYLIGSGLAEGLAQGIVAAAVIGSPWAAVGIGVEEAAQETAEWGGGAYIFGRIWSPVILEGSLVSVADGKTIWSKTALESSNRKALKKRSKEDQQKREVRLRVTAQRAASTLVKKLDKKAWSNLKDAGDPPGSAH